MGGLRCAAPSLLGVAAPFFVSLPPDELADPDSRFISFGGLRVHFEIGGHGQPVSVPAIGGRRHV